MQSSALPAPRSARLVDLLSLANAALRRQALSEDLVRELDELPAESDPREAAARLARASALAAGSAALLCLALAEVEKRGASRPLPWRARLVAWLLLRLVRPPTPPAP